MNDAVVNCHKCGAATPVPPGQKVLRRDTCSRCGADLHCCYNCRFYDPGKHNQCAETQAEYVQYKDEANFCEYFEPGRWSAAAGSAADEARRRLDSLFRK